MVNSFSSAQFEKYKPLLLELLFVVLLGCALGHAGPYGTYEKFNLLTRSIFWVAIITLPWAISKTLFFLAKKFAPANLSNNYLSVLLTPVLALIGSAVTSVINIELGLHQDKEFFEVWPQSILVWLIFGFLIILPMIWAASALAKEQRKTGVTTMMEFFHHKLPESLRHSQLFALKAEDHYLRILTDCGSALILMKLEDALAALNGYPGIQTHRSWWVAASQLEGLETLSAQSSGIHLPDGTVVPVSRRKRKTVNEYIDSLSTNVQ